MSRWSPPSMGDPGWHRDVKRRAEEAARNREKDKMKPYLACPICRYSFTQPSGEKSCSIDPGDNKRGYCETRKIAWKNYG